MKQLIVVTSVLVMALAATALAQTSAPEQNVKRDSQPSADFAAIMLAQQLAEYGYRQQAPDALLLAAQMLLDAPVPQPEAAAGASRENAAALPDTVSPATLLHDAKALAEGNEALTQLAAQIETRLAETPRGLVEGRKTLVSDVAARSHYTFTGVFEAGQPAQVLLVNTGDSALELFVYDEHGHLIDGVKPCSGSGHLAWVPRWTGEFVIVVNNPGDVSNTFLLLIGYKQEYV